MELLQFYFITIVILFATILWLWRQGRKRSQFAYALYGLAGLQLLGLALSYVVTIFPPVNWLVLGLQIVCWGCLLWGLELDWRLAFVLLVIAVPAFAISLFPIIALLTWGFVMAIPFAAVADLRQRTSFPIFATTPMANHLKPVTTQGHITAEMVNSEQPILECLTDGVLICGPSGLVYAVNQAATVILGIEEMHLIGRPITDMLAYFPLLDEVNSHKEDMKTRRYDINGRTVEGQMNLIYDNEGGVQGTVVILRDITSEYQAELARDNFLTTVSHELRTPLTAIKGYVELLQTGTGGQLTEPQLAFLATIQRNVSKMVQLINSLIFAASIKGGRMEYKAGHANLPQLIQQIVREMRATAAETNKTFKVDIDSRLHMIEVDPIHVAMILEELMANGLKYGRDGGEVRVVAVLESEEFAVISVEDDGIGIAAEDQAHIFEDFYRPEWRDEQLRASGIGMGLSIVRALVEAYNGRIWFESTPDKGTTFTFILPLHQAEKQEALSIPAMTPSA